MASISSGAFDRGIECSYVDEYNRIILHSQNGRQRWISLHRGRLDATESVPSPNDQHPLLLDLPMKMAFALWLCARRRGLLDLNPEDYTP